jgi:peptidoglycan/xylan/chitin deacetylase (PgdA/CDA1 family)
LLKPTDNAIEKGLTVVPAVFRRQLAYLHRHRFHTITAVQLVRAIRGQGSLPSNPIALTFDDGYSDIYPNVYRLLRARHLTATFFIVPGFLNKPRYLTWSQVEDMSRHGMDIEAHTMTHPDLTTVGATQLWNELEQSRMVLQKRLRGSIRIMAYPYGTYSPVILQAVKRAGYLAAFTTSYGKCGGRNTLLTLPRIYANKLSAQPISDQ